MEQKRSIAVAADDERGLEGFVSGHFGRCPAYVVVDAEGARILRARVEANPHANNHKPGQVPMYIRGLGVNAIVAGGMGPRALELFSRYGIDVATGASGRVRDVVEAYLKGNLQGTAPCAHDHSSSCGGHNG